jgi:hypothetical protein
LERYTHTVAATDPRRAAPKVFSRVTFMFWYASDIPLVLNMRERVGEKVEWEVAIEERL